MKNGLLFRWFVVCVSLNETNERPRHRSMINQMTQVSFSIRCRWKSAIAVCLFVCLQWKCGGHGRTVSQARPQRGMNESRLPISLSSSWWNSSFLFFIFCFHSIVQLFVCVSCGFRLFVCLFWRRKEKTCFHSALGTNVAMAAAAAMLQWWWWRRAFHTLKEKSLSLSIQSLIIKTTTTKHKSPFVFVFFWPSAAVMVGVLTQLVEYFVQSIVERWASSASPLLSSHPMIPPYWKVVIISIEAFSLFLHFYQERKKHKSVYAFIYTAKRVHHSSMFFFLFRDSRCCCLLAPNLTQSSQGPFHRRHEHAAAQPSETTNSLKMVGSFVFSFFFSTNLWLKIN